jgi:hypothetical protein
MMVGAFLSLPDRHQGEGVHKDLRAVCAVVNGDHWVENNVVGVGHMATGSLLWLLG